MQQQQQYRDTHQAAMQLAAMQQVTSSKQQAANRRLIHKVKYRSLLIRCKSDSLAALPHAVILHADAAAVLP